MSISECWTLGVDASNRGFHTTAAEQFACVTSLDPTNAEGWRMLAVALGSLRRHEEALQAAERAASLDTSDAGCLVAHGAALLHCGQFQDARNLLNRALRIAPDMPVARWNRASCNLALGLWKEGWADYDWGRTCNLRPVRHTSPEWDGSPLRSTDTLLLWAEQGFGDAMMMSRFIPLAQERAGCNVVIECPSSLVDLFVSSFPGILVYARRRDSAFPIPFDSHCSLFSLPLALGIETPSAAGFLTAPHSESKTENVTRIGYCHSGSDDPRLPVRNIPPEEFAAVLPSEVETVSLYPPENPALVSWGATANIVSGLDAVVTIDTGMVSLANALDVPAAVLVPFAADWRYGAVPPCSEWFPNARLFRQSVPGDWSEPIERARTYLEQFRCR